MAFTITIKYRFDRGEHIWTATPTFVCKGMTWGQEPSVEANSSYIAFDKLRSAMLKLDIPTECKHMLCALDHRNFYAAPERNNNMDLCVDMDGRKPTREQYAERRIKYINQTGQYELLKHRV